MIKCVRQHVLTKEEAVMTITEIAKKSGVSIGTVDRVLHNRGKVSEKTKLAVEVVIEKYGYTPNPLARTLKKNKPFVIGVLMPPPGTGSGYWQMIFKGMKEAESELSAFGIKLEFEYFDRTEYGSMTKASQRLFEKNLQALITVPIVPQEAEEIFSHIEIPYIFVDSPLPRANPVITIAQNPYRGGQCAGHIMKLLKGSGKFSVLRFYKDSYNLLERLRGFTDYFKNDTNCQVIETISPNGTNQVIFNFLDNLFKSEPEINGIFATHTEGFIIGQYLSYTNRKNKVALISYDMQEQNRNGLMTGNIDCVISQRPEYQGYTSVNEIFKSKVLLQEIPQRIFVPIDVIFKENAGEYNPIKL